MQQPQYGSPPPYSRPAPTPSYSQPGPDQFQESRYPSPQSPSQIPYHQQYQQQDGYLHHHQPPASSHPHASHHQCPYSPSGHVPQGFSSPSSYHSHPTALLIRRPGGRSTLALHGPDGLPLYFCTRANHLQQLLFPLPSKPDYVVTHQPSGHAVGSIRYHHWTRDGGRLDYWEAGGARGGSGLWRWEAEPRQAGNSSSEWRCVSSAAENAGAIVAMMKTTTYNSDGEAAVLVQDVVARCELYDPTILLDPARRGEMDELAVSAFAALNGAMKATKARKEEAEVAEAIAELAAA